MLLKKIHYILAISIAIVAPVVGCSSGGQRSFPTQVLVATSGSSIKVSPHVTSETHAPTDQRDIQQRHKEIISPASPSGDTNDYCNTNPQYWECVPQGGANTDTRPYFPELESGCTVSVLTTPPSSKGASFSVSPSSTNVAPYDFVVTITATSTAIIGNNFTYSYTEQSVCPQNADAYPGTTTWDFTGYYQVQCSLQAGNCPLIQIYDSDLAKTVSGSPAPTTSSIIGEQQNLAMQYVMHTGSAASYTTASPMWTIAGSPIKNYSLGIVVAPTAAPSVQQLIAPTDFQLASMTPFFWMMPGTNSIKATESLTGNLGANGTEMAFPVASAVYAVLPPTGISLSGFKQGMPIVLQPTPSPSMSPVVDLESGQDISPYGLTYNFEATVPSGFTGVFDITQVAQRCAYYITSGIKTYNTNNRSKPALDDSSLFLATPEPALEATDYDIPNYGHAFDSTYTFITNSDSFQSFFVFKPDGAGAGRNKGIWVPLGYLKWGWQNSATQTSPNVWKMTTPNGVSGPTESSPNFAVNFGS